MKLIISFLIVSTSFAQPIINNYFPSGDKLWVRKCLFDTSRYEIIERAMLFYYPNARTCEDDLASSFAVSENKLFFVRHDFIYPDVIRIETIADFSCQKGDSFKINTVDSLPGIFATCLSSDSTVITALDTFKNCYVFKRPKKHYTISSPFWHHNILIYAPGIPFVNDLIYFKSDSLEIGQLPFEWPLTSAPNVKEQIPESFTLAQNYPNPFNSETVIEFNLSRLSETDLAVYDVAGREIKTIVSGQLPPGAYSEKWNGTDNSGNAVASGVYFIRLKSGQYSKFIKAVYSK